MQYRYGTAYLQSGLVATGAVIECPGRGVEQHHGDQAVQHHGEHQRDQVEQRDVREEHSDVHRRVAVVSEITLGNLKMEILYRSKGI